MLGADEGPRAAKHAHGKGYHSVQGQVPAGRLGLAPQGSLAYRTVVTEQKRERHPRDQRKGSRRRRRPHKPGESPAKVIVKAKAVDTSKPADIPLSAAEVVEMREHFKFLRDNRKLLQLRLNAAEDLLINGVREPTHRGVCKHLLGKVDRARVELAAPRLEPAARSRFLAGIVKFSPDVAYLLLYLESVKESASQSDATAALSRALRQIDFTEISSAQMRRLLDLIAELFDERDRPQLLFGLLQSPTFRGAFDRSAEQLPSNLADSFVPLRAAHAVVIQGKKNPHDGAALSRGVTTLLSAREKVLRGHSPTARKRLLDLGTEIGRGNLQAVGPGLRLLVEALPDERERSDGMLRLAGLYLSAERDADAKRILERLRKQAPGFRRPVRWLEALAGPRFGRFALPAGDARPKRGGSRFQVAFALRLQRPVWLRTGKPEDADVFKAATELSSSLLIPNVLPHIGGGTGPDDAPYFAVDRRGRGAFETLKQDGGLSYEDAAMVCEDVVTLLATLTSAEVPLPDVRLDRFAIDAGPRLWLRDLLGATKSSQQDAHPTNLKHAKELCGLVLAAHPAAAALKARLDTASSFAAMASELR